MSKLVDDVKSGLKGIRGAGDALRGEVLNATDQAFDTDPNHPKTLNKEADSKVIAEKGKQDMRGADNMIARREWEHKGVEPPAHVGHREHERPNDGLNREPGKLGRMSLVSKGWREACERTKFNISSGRII
ncbi:hypothetical protein FPOA_05019 [Fusarium poae]|uniref:Uncharacterized protein n=1 Tax=Fusarium poae TaxID=36050 RepID=A0A1B8AVG4_FUSPO|nr:hypothetical protein FPOA_05019 [Fusarium poae]